MRIRLAITAAVGACLASCHAEPVPDNQSVAMCIAREDWPKLIAGMERFARANDLKLIGGTEPDPMGKPSLNVAVAKGYNYYFGDNLDLWVTSDPFRANVISYGAVGRHNPINHEQWELARGLIRELLPLASLANGTHEEPSCAEAAATQTPR